MKSSTFRSAVRSGCGRLVSLGVLFCACGAAALEPPPRCAFETFSNATFDEPDGAAAALGNLELLAKGGYDVVLLTLRCRNDLNSPAVRDLARRYYARARELGVRVCQDIDPRIARARFLEKHPEDAQEMLRIVTAPATNGVAETLVIQPSCGDHMTGGTRPYDAIRGEILRAWAIRKLPDGTVRAREIPFDATPVATERIRVRAKGLTADEELAVLARFAFFSCDVFSPHLAAYGRSLLADYRELGASSAFRDEWGFPPSFLPGQEEHRAFWYSRHYAAAYRAATGRDLVGDALLFAFPLEGRSAAERSAAITAYMRLNWERNAAIEQDFYAAVKETFGPDAYVAKHPTWFPVIGWREFLHNGLDWWQATRDFAQTDETTPVPAACGMAKKFGGSVWLNEGYQTNETLYAEFVWRYAAAGGRMVFHQVYPPTLPKYRPMPPLERARARHEDVLRASRRARDMVRLLDRISSAPIDCPVAWAFGHSRVAWDWTDAAYGDWGGPGVYGLWQRGYGVDLYPSTEFAALSVGADGWLRVGAQRYTALVLHNLSAADRAAFAKLTEGKDLKTRVFESGEGVADFLDALGGVTRQMPMPAYVDNARQPCGEWVSLLPTPDGVLTLTDGTRARIKATGDAQRGDPIEGTLVLADGSRFEYAARGLFAANGRFVAGADVTRIRGPGVDFSSATPRDVVLARAAEAAVSVDFTKKSGRIRRINGMNGGPQIVGRGDLVEKAAAEYAALAVPNARLHDIPLVTPGLKVCDVPHIFPIYNPKADPKDAANYYFKPTDDYIRNLKACGVESITYRLGTSIEWTHPRTYFARCPKDIDQFAEVCAGIVRHYSKGWADGFDAGKVYWEIWCEPNSNGSGELWDKGKGIETYWPLYTAVAKRIKAEFPDALVGGPSSNCYDFKLAERMADVCKDEGAALDFFSWHQYISTIEPFDGKIRELREMFDRKGFAKTELHLNEWHWMPACWSDLGDLKSLMRWEDAPDGINGIESAAFALRTLIGLQESAIDMTDYYMAFDYSSWGLYDRKRELRPNYWPLAWFGALARDAVCRVEATAADGEVSVIAGLTADGAKTALVSDFRPTSRDPLVVRLAGVPPDGHVAVTTLRADGRPVTESVRLRDGALFLDRTQGSSVYRIETPARRILSPDGRVGDDRGGMR